MNVFVPEFIRFTCILFHQILVDNGAHEPHRLQECRGITLFDEFINMTNIPISLDGFKHYRAAVPAVNFRIHRHEPREPDMRIAFQIPDDFGPLLCADLISIELRIRQHIEILKKQMVIALAANTALVLDGESVKIRKCLLGKLAEHAFADVAFGTRGQSQTTQSALKCLAISLERPLFFANDGSRAFAHFANSIVLIRTSRSAIASRNLSLSL